MTTFAALSEVYRQRHAHAWKPSTLETYAALEKLLAPLIGRQDIRKLTHDSLLELQAELARQVSAARANMALSYARGVLDYGVHQGTLPANPARGLRRLAQKRTTVDPLTPDELQLVLANTDPWFRPLFTTLAWTGARPNELLALRWSHVDLDNGFIRIEQGRVRGKEGLPKTACGQRAVPILPPVKEALLLLREVYKIAGLSCRAYVFMTRDGKPINGHLDRTWRQACQKAEVRARPAYQLRHTFGSLCVRQGIPLGWVSETMGHASIAVTAQHYIRYMPDKNKDELQKLQALFA